jgi:glycosyltransferase 2 family protein
VTARGRFRGTWALARPLAGAGILGVLVWRLGSGPFLDAIGRLDPWSVAAAVAIAAVTTAACAWRWALVARGLGVALPLGSAVAACYRSQFLNTTLPGGVLGDVHRGVRHGRDVRDVGAGLRSVVWERAAGQVVLVALAVVVVTSIPSPLRSSMPVVGLFLLSGVLGVVLLVLALPRIGSPAWARRLRILTEDLRGGLLDRRTWPPVVLASTVAVAGHAATFLVAARAVGATAPTMALLPLTLLVLAAMSVPVNLAGWGPREGAAAWAFSMAGLGADQGVATAVAYGVLALVSSLPGALVLLAGPVRQRLRTAQGADLTGRPSLPRRLEGVGDHG